MKNFIIKLLEEYKKNSVRFWISNPFILYSNCKYSPTCSEYTTKAIDKYGTLRGLSKGFVRILKCNPLSRGGVDLP